MVPSAGLYESQDGNDMFSQLYNITNRLGNVDLGRRLNLVYKIDSVQTFSI